ncbi:MAG: hypothetical protein RSF42_16695 [Comamonas sp.]
MPEAPKPGAKLQPKMVGVEIKPSPAAADQPTDAPAALPLARVQQVERGDDALACIAMLSKLPLDKVTELAYTLGYPKFGPAYVPDDMLAALAMKAGHWVAKNYKDFTSFETLPPIAILYVDYSEQMDIGRTVLWLRPPQLTDPGTRASPVASRSKQESPRLDLGSRVDLGHGLVIDPAFWIRTEQQILTGAATLHFVPGWFMELAKAVPKP